MIPKDVELCVGMRIRSDYQDDVKAIVHSITGGRVRLRFLRRGNLGYFTYGISTIKNVFTLLPSDELARSVDDT